MRAIETLAGALALLLALGASAVASPAHRDEAMTAACAHFENRARFKPREGSVEFVTVLADACAQIAGETHESAPNDAAQAFLMRLAAAREAITAINRARLAAPRPKRGLDGPQRRDLRQSLRLVSASGEFLILRQAGVFEALHRWAANRPGFTLAAALP